MARGFDPKRIEREFRAAQRKADADWRRQAQRYNREVERVDRENQRRIDAHNRKVEAHNKKVVADYNRDVDRVNTHNRAVDAQQRATIAALDRRLRLAESGPRYTMQEQALADRVQHAVAGRESREWDTFVSYARIDGAEVPIGFVASWRA